jgi:hypothetical protein
MRETKIITTPFGNHQVEIKTYLTGREKRALTSVYLQGNLSFNTEDKDIKGFQSGILEQAENLAWQTVIVSINGKSENIIETILDMRAEDYQMVVKAVNEIVADKDFTEKKTA